MRKFQFLRANPLLVYLVVEALLGATDAYARGGGGHSFSGGSSHSYSGGSGYSGGSYSGSGGSLNNIGLFYLLSRLSFIQMLVLVVLIVIGLWVKAKYFPSSDDGSGNDEGAVPAYYSPPEIDGGLSTLMAEDPEFSMPLFRDFCFALYSTLHHARGQGEAEVTKYKGYLSDFACQELLAINRNRDGVNHPIIGVVIGSFQVTSITEDQKQTKVSVSFDANFTEETIGTSKQQSFYSREVWIFVRDRGVRSRKPALSTQIQCPSCGSPAKSDLHGKCPACNQLIRSGVYDWFIHELNVLEISNRPPLLTSTVAEVGTDFPTIYDRHLPEMQTKALAELHLADFNSMNDRAQQIFYQLQKTWSARDLNLLRPYETNSLYETHLYWIEEYKKQKLVNRLEDVRIEKVELVKIFIDAHYVSVTLRIFAVLKDWTETEAGQTVCGSKYNPREFSEYWTLIRSRSFQAPKGGFNQCPACGAPSKINQAGVCEYCHSLVTSGEFDWVLSSIEQDESYRG